MRIAVVGGGPGGLYFAALAKQLGPGHDVTVWNRSPEAVAEVLVLPAPNEKP